MLGRAGHVGVLEDIRAAVHAWALAVPDTKHAIELFALRVQVELLGAPHGGGAQFLVHAGLKDDVVGRQVLLGRPQRLVIGAQRAATVAADEAGGVQTRRRIALALQHGQAHQGLHAAHEGAPVVEGVFVFQAYRLKGFADRLGQGGVHGCLRGVMRLRHLFVGSSGRVDRGIAVQFRHCAALCAFVFMPRLPSIQKGSFLEWPHHEWFG